MASIEIENLSFAYNGSDKSALKDVSIDIADGEFVVLCGKSGCGKTTLLRLLKRQLAPVGKKSGKICVDGVSVEKIDERTSVSTIGMVMQDPDAQIVSDSVWHELAFGLENLGYESGIIRAKIAEICGFLGITDLFDKKTQQLSGGQKQLVNLASVLVAEPKILLLDEPTAQLDPVAAEDFFFKLKRLNEQCGMTIVVAEHRSEEVFPLADKIVYMSDGEVVFCGSPRRFADECKTTEERFSVLTSASRLFVKTGGKGICPLSVKEGRKYLFDNFDTTYSTVKASKCDNIVKNKLSIVMSIEKAFFRYERDEKDVLRDLTLDVYKGEALAVFGGNGSGKTTLLRVLCGLAKPYQGKYKLCGLSVKRTSDTAGKVALLPQNPRDLFVRDTVEKELYDTAEFTLRDKSKRSERVADVAEAVGLANLMSRHPYDLSGGETQRLALGKVLVADPQVLLLDEPTKGLDVFAKREVAALLSRLRNDGKTIVAVTHDMEFAAMFADRCAMFFDGKITTVRKKRDFFVGNAYYTTAARRLTKGFLADAITTGEAAEILNGQWAVKYDDKN